MKFNIVEWTLLDLYKRRNQISFPVYQRQEIWYEDKKKLLIDSIFRGLDIPKLYFQVKGDAGEEQWDCIDGHQRIASIVGFFDGEFKYNGSTFEQLSDGDDGDKKVFEDYKLTITMVEEISDEEVRLLFLRLNLGVPANAGEKLNAIKSNLGDFVNEIAEHPFIKRISIPTRRYAKQQVCAQICNNSIYKARTGEFRNSKYEDLENLYRTFKDFSFQSPEATQIKSTLDALEMIFEIEARQITNRAGVVSIYLLVEEMLREGNLEEKEDDVRDFYIEFLRALRVESRLGINFTNPLLKTYEIRVIQAADSKAAVTERHNRLKEAFEYWLKKKQIIGYS